MKGNLTNHERTTHAKICDFIWDIFISQTSTVPSTNICQFEVKHKVKAVCVRAKDALCNSQWSEWSYLRLVPVPMPANQTVYMFSVALILC